MAVSFALVFRAEALVGGQEGLLPVRGAVDVAHLELGELGHLHRAVLGGQLEGARGVLQGQGLRLEGPGVLAPDHGVLAPAQGDLPGVGIQLGQFRHAEEGRLPSGVPQEYGVPRLELRLGGGGDPEATGGVALDQDGVAVSAQEDQGEEVLPRARQDGPHPLALRLLLQALQSGQGLLLASEGGPLRLGGAHGGGQEPAGPHQEERPHRQGHQKFHQGKGKPPHPLQGRGGSPQSGRFKTPQQTRGGPQNFDLSPFQRSSQVAHAQAPHTPREAGASLAGRTPPSWGPWLVPGANPWSAPGR